MTISPPDPTCYLITLFRFLRRILQIPRSLFTFFQKENCMRAEPLLRSLLCLQHPAQFTVASKVSETKEVCTRANGSSACHRQRPGSSNNRGLFLTVLEAVSSRSRCRQVPCPLRGLLLACGQLSSHGVLT